MSAGSTPLLAARPTRSIGRKAVEEAAQHILDRKRADQGSLSIGSMTLADLSDGPTPEPLIGTYLTEDEATIIYGPGGVGKGMTAVYFAQRLTEQGRSVMIIDFEGHEGEWGRRSRAMGFADDQLKMVHYREPFGRSWEAPNGSLYTISESIKNDCDALGISVVIIDSYVAATSSGDSMGGQASAKEYFDALTIIGRTSLTIAHVAGNSDRFPAKPFGSVFVHNFARETWAINAAENAVSEVEFDPATNPLQPSVMTIELRNMKMSQRQKVPMPQFMSFSFFLDGHVEVEGNAPNTTPTVAEMAKDVIDRAGKPLTVSQIIKGIEADYGAKQSPEAMRKVLGRRHRSGTFQKNATSPLTWSVAS